MIEIRNLKKSFGSNLVWENVSFDIGDGETVAIIGRSGCGKSVLVKHLNALIYPDSGEVIIDGENVFDLEYVALRKMRQRFGVLFQGSALLIRSIPSKILHFLCVTLRIFPKRKLCKKWKKHLAW